MCGTSNNKRTCGICVHAGSCLAAIGEDLFYPASLEAVEKRLENNNYPGDKLIMEEYVKDYDIIGKWKDFYR